MDLSGVLTRLAVHPQRLSQMLASSRDMATRGGSSTLVACVTWTRFSLFLGLRVPIDGIWRSLWKPAILFFWVQVIDLI